MKLYEINEELSKLLAEIDDTGELTPEQEKQLDKLELSKAEKIKNIGYQVLNLEAHASACNDSAKHFKQKAKRAEARAEWLRNYLGPDIEGAFQIDELTIQWRDCPPSVIVLDEDEIPKTYWKRKVTHSIDKATISQDIKSGATVPGAMLSAGRKLVIK